MKTQVARPFPCRTEAADGQGMYGSYKPVTTEDEKNGLKNDLAPVAWQAFTQNQTITGCLSNSVHPVSYRVTEGCKQVMPCPRLDTKYMLLRRWCACCSHMNQAESAAASISFGISQCCSRYCSKKAFLNKRQRCPNDRLGFQCTWSISLKILLIARRPCHYITLCSSCMLGTSVR